MIYLWLSRLMFMWPISRFPGQFVRKSGLGRPFVAHAGVMAQGVNTGLRELPVRLSMVLFANEGNEHNW